MTPVQFSATTFGLTHHSAGGRLMSDLRSLLTPEVGGALGSLFHILAGGFRGSTIHALMAFAAGLIFSIVVGPMLVDLWPFHRSGAVEIGIHFLSGAFGMTAYAKIVRVRVSGKFAGIAVETSDE